MMKTTKLLLLAAAAGGALCCVGARTPAGESLQVHVVSVLEYVSPDGFKPSGGGGGTVTLVGARNGIYAAQLVVVGGKAGPGIRAKPTDLKGPSAIPASAVEVFYAVPDGRTSARGRKRAFDSLEPTPPAKGAAVQPLWIRVRVPKSAKAGDYAGSIRVSSNGASRSVALKLKVVDWTLPDPTAYHGRMDVVQSPDSVAMAYDAKMWGEKHMKLLDRTFSLMGEMGCKTLYVTAVRRTHFGNEHAMVRWRRDEKRELQPDFTVVEKYLDVATRHLGKVPGVVFYCWEPTSSQGHAGRTAKPSSTHDRPVMYTLWNPKTGRLGKRKGPAWGTPESRVFWKKFTDGLKPVLEKRGLEKSLLFGLIGDHRPTKVSMNDITNAVEGAKWAVHSHHYCRSWQGHPVGMGIALWGIPVRILPPEKGRGYSWKNPFWLSYYPREFAMYSNLCEFRYKLEAWMGGFNPRDMSGGVGKGARGLGRIGGDFWVVLRDARGRATATLAGRYPEAAWGQLNLNYCLSYIFGRGRDGAVRTVRSEALREGAQDMETRIFIEKAVEGVGGAKVSGALAKRCRALLDTRIRTAIRAGMPGKKKQRTLDPKWREYNHRLYELAGEVARELGKR
jgi:hypothetical protein